MKWIKASDKLPTDCESNHLVIVNGRFGSIQFHNAILLAQYDPRDTDNGGWFIEMHPHAKDIQIDYWMKLPELPTETKEDNDRLLRMYEQIKGQISINEYMKEK